MSGVKEGEEARSTFRASTSYPPHPPTIQHLQSCSTCFIDLPKAAVSGHTKPPPQG